MTTSHIAFIAIVFLPVKSKVNLKICKISLILGPTSHNNHGLTIMKTFFFLRKENSAHYPGVGHGKWVLRLSYLWFPDIYNSFSDKLICNVQCTWISYRSREHLKEDQKKKNPLNERSLIFFNKVSKRILVLLPECYIENMWSLGDNEVLSPGSQ